MPIGLALEMFIESGDLPMSKYPALEELAGIIAQVLNVDKTARARRFVGTYVSRRGKEISIYKEGQRYRIGKNTGVNQSLVNKVDEYLRRSENFRSSAEIEEELEKYYHYKALGAHIWNALRVLISLGKVKRYGSGNNTRYKAT